MVKEIAIYLEGGGDKPETLAPFRQGMSTFLNPLVEEARKHRIRWSVIPCGGRSQAYEAFKSALKTDPDTYNVLLVDAEEAVSDREKPWEHLKTRPGDEWTKPAKAKDEHCHLMIVTMETWFLADVPSLTELLKKTKGFDPSVFPAMPPAPRPPRAGDKSAPHKPITFLESKSKSAVNAILRKAFRQTDAGEYRKIDHGAKMLAAIDPDKVRQQCPSCERLFKALGTVLGNKNI